MPTSPTPDSSAAALHNLALAWLLQSREACRPRGEPLGDALVQTFRPFFGEPALLDVRVLRMASLRAIDDSAIAAHFPPDTMPIDLGRVRGLTLVDTVCLGLDRIADAQEERSVLFQELVHVLQFRRLGAAGFLQAYLAGWAGHGMQHDTIPIEREAARLRQRFDAGENLPFSVAEELASHDPRD